MKATFDVHGIQIMQYPFRPASIKRRGRVLLSAIRDVDPAATPPEIRTLSGETLFISAEQKQEFEAYIEDTQLPIVHRIDVWHLLLEPFLDTEFSSKQQEETLAVLGSLGLLPTEVSNIRDSGAMLAYNFFLWDWGHLGLFDLLTATHQGLNWLSVQHRLYPKSYTKFYWSALVMADRGHR